MKYDEKLSKERERRKKQPKTKCYAANLIERNNLEQNEYALTDKKMNLVI